MKKCYGCGEETVATHSIETWDEGDGMITIDYCGDCFAALDNRCDRCEVEGCNVNGFGLCQDCLDDYNRGDNY